MKERVWRRGGAEEEVEEFRPTLLRLYVLSLKWPGSVDQSCNTTSFPFYMNIIARVFLAFVPIFLNSAMLESAYTFPNAPVLVLVNPSPLQAQVTPSHSSSPRRPSEQLLLLLFLFPCEEDRFPRRTQPSLTQTCRIR